MLGTMQELFDRTGKRYQVNVAWYRDDTDVGTIRVHDRNDITPYQLPCRRPCAFCKAGILHSEILHEETLWREE